MNWKSATDKQLKVIVSHHEDCPLWLKVEAKAELLRRQKYPHRRTQMRRKEHFG